MQFLKGGTLMYYMSGILYYVYVVNREDRLIYRTDDLQPIVEGLLGIFKEGNDGKIVFVCNKDLSSWPFLKLFLVSIYISIFS